MLVSCQASSKKLVVEDVVEDKVTTVERSRCCYIVHSYNLFEEAKNCSRQSTYATRPPMICCYLFCTHKRGGKVDSLDVLR